MTKILSKTLIILTALIIAFATIVGVMVHISMESKSKEVTEKSLYIRRAEILNIERATDLVECSDEFGTIWAFYGADEWNEGDFILLLMNSADPTNPIDDEIVSVRLDPFAY